MKWLPLHLEQWRLVSTEQYKVTSIKLRGFSYIHSNEVCYVAASGLLFLKLLGAFLGSIFRLVMIILDTY